MPMMAPIRELVEKRKQFLLENRNSITVDADTHISDPNSLPATLYQSDKQDPSYFHGRTTDVENLIREMDLCGIDMSLCWQNPSATPYGHDRDSNAANLLAANRYIFECASDHPTRIYPAGWTDPKALGLDNALELVDICTMEFGFSIIKMNPAQNAYPIDSDDVFSVVERIVERGAVPAFHFGADTPYTPASGLEVIAKRHPDHPVIGVHFGGGGAGYVEAEQLYKDARALGLRQPNIYFIQSAKRDTHIEADLITYRTAKDTPWKRIFLASDAPYGRQAWNFGGYRAMFKSLGNGGDGTDPRHAAAAPLFDAETIQDFMGRNFADFASAACQRLLDAS